MSDQANEHTSKRVAHIASELLTDLGQRTEHMVYVADGITMKVLCSARDLKSVAASALTQTRNADEF